MQLILLQFLSQNHLCMCVEGLCNIFFCAINNRFVWVLPLLLPLPVPRCLTHLFCCWCLRWMSLEVRHRSCDPGNASQGRDRALSTKTHYRGTRAINHEFTAVCCCYYYSLHKSEVLCVLRLSLKDLPVLS